MTDSDPLPVHRDTVDAVERQFERLFGVQAIGRLGKIVEKMGMISVED